MAESSLSSVRMKLCDALSSEPAVITKLANHLEGKSLITESTRQGVVGTEGVKPYDQATKLADAVIFRLKGPQNAPDNWNKLLEALRCCGLGDLAEDLELEKSDIQSTSGISSCDSSVLSPLNLTRDETEGSDAEDGKQVHVAQVLRIIPNLVHSGTSNTPEQHADTIQEVSYAVNSPVDLNSSSSSKEVQLKFLDPIRQYQHELAAPGLNGENYIICAPTGSGKTLVAAMIITDHLQNHWKNGEQTGKVVFIAKTQQLARQQKEKMVEYIDGARVVEVTGDSELHIAPLIPQVDIIVCTTGKLCNELRSKSVTMDQFTLLMVDECHHTIGNDDYANVMEYHLLQKLKDDPQKAPQVVGLTASPGAGKGKSPTLIKAINHQLLLCAHLDASSGIKLVTKNAEELSHYSNKPEHELTILDPRSPTEAFHQRITETMKALEGMIGGSPPFDHSSIQYQQWVEKEKEAAEIRVEQRERDRISILEHLQFYFLALLTYEDFTSEDTISVLKGVPIFPDATATPIEKSLNEILGNLLITLRQIPEVSNPLLLGAQEILIRQFQNNPQSKAIFFVRAVKHTEYVCQWVRNHPVLKGIIRAESITGHTRAGMTKEQQAKVVEGFKSGKYNLLASTTVLEEGLDVAACNLVIRFQMMSNEIAQVQAQGRARAKESKMYTIVSSQSEKQCQQLINEEKKALALQAIQFIPIMLAGLRSTQQGILLKREIREKAAAKHRQCWKPNDVDILCKHCTAFACKASEVNTFRGHYVVPDKSFRQRLNRRAHHKPDIPGTMSKLYKISCARCSTDWGIWGWWRTDCLEFPLLKCSSFIFKHTSGDRKPIKNWSKVPFEVYPLAESYRLDDD